ncbi:MAG: nuclear transport factor 2 family protein [Mycobacteriaceae bacterium]|nr:nuclear transport factor 2 family protein [Mycobacteriaceae bacterium]
MAAVSRDKLEEFVGRWLATNREAERAGDWTPLADFYTADATYGWNIGPKEDVMCVGRDEIREIALGLEMAAPGPDDRALIEWQRDFFDFGHVQKLYLQLMKAGKLSQGMQRRIERSLAGEKLPGYYPIGQAPVPIW